MEKTYTIQEMVGITGLTAHTLRYYERIGLLDHVTRDSNGYRRYRASDITWIDFLTRLRATGMPVRKMQQVADLRRKGEETISERRVLLEEHENKVAKKIAELEANFSEIKRKVLYYKQM